MKPNITPDDSITVKKGFFFNYHRRLKSLKVSQKGEPLTLHLNRTRQVTFLPSLQRMKLPVCLYGIYTNGCLFDYAALSSGDKLKLDHFYPEIERWIVSYTELKKVKAKTKKKLKKK